MSSKRIIKKQFEFIDLFAGIGGFHLAIHSVGGNCVFASEWDKYARITYEENYKSISPELFKKGDFNWFIPSQSFVGQLYVFNWRYRTLWYRDFGNFSFVS